MDTPQLRRRSSGASHTTHARHLPRISLTTLHTLLASHFATAHKDYTTPTPFRRALTRTKSCPIQHCCPHPFIPTIRKKRILNSLTVLRSSLHGIPAHIPTNNSTHSRTTCPILLPSYPPSPSPPSLVPTSLPYLPVIPQKPK